jgi:hypothetical protein
MSKKLVTIFASHFDCFIMTQNIALIHQIRDFRSGQILQPRQFIFRRDLQKLRHGGLPAGTISRLKNRDS